MSYEIVAERSKNLAQKYVNEGNFGRAFSHYLVAFNLKPDWRIQFKEEFSTILCNWGTLLEERKQYEDLFKCYEQAVEVFPNDAVILNNLGAHLLRCGFLKEATHYFRKCLQVNPYFLRARENLENVSNLAVERWHFRMLNDQHRNEAFREAIIKKIKQGFDKVLDVGTGTGLLSLFCSEGKAKQIYACDSSPIMSRIAEQVFHFNSIHDVKLINKHSSELRLLDDIHERVSLLVTETFDAGLLGEDILQTLSHAWKHLLLPPRTQSQNNYAVVLPFGAAVYVTGIEFETVANDFHLKQNRGFSFENPALRICDNYDTYDLSRCAFKCLTRSEKILEISFNDPVAIDEVLKGWEKSFSLKCLTSGRIDCFAVWFDLHLDEDITLSTNPFSKNGAWDQAIFPLPRSECFQEGQNMTITAEFKHKLLIRMNDGDKLSECAVKILNNNKLTNVFNQVVDKFTRTFNESVTILDCYPFPVFGLNFLINRKNIFKDELTCFVTTEYDRHFVKIIAEKYSIAVDVIINSDIDLECVLDKKFDIILVDVIEINGRIKDGVLLQYNHLKSLLKPRGCILPNHVSVIGEFVRSDWLAKASKVINDSVTLGYKIADYINLYQVQNFFDIDLKSIESIKTSEDFELFNLFDSLESIKEMKISRHIGNRVANALVYWLKIRFIEGCDEFLTVDSDCYCQGAILFEETELSDEIRFNVIRNNGLFSIELLKD